MSNKRAQATVFIIIALVVGAVIVGGFYTNKYILKSQWDREAEASATVPPQAQEIYDFTISCIQQTAEHAIDIAGSNAGFVNTPEDKAIIPIQKNTVQIIGSLEIPYWYYNNQHNLPTEQIPSEKQIQAQIAEYINQNLNTCLDNFIDFQKFNIQQEEIKTETKIKANQILIKVDFPLNIEFEDFKFNFKQFYTEVKKPLGYLYNQAKIILKEEQTTNFLEEKILDTIIIYDETPFSGATDDCIPPFWIKDEVIKNLKQILSDNIQFIKIKNTNYEMPEELKYFEVPTSIKDKDLDVNFLYLPFWPNEIEINPEENGILKSQSITESLGVARAIVEPFVCRSIYQFVYDIKIPILITLTKDDYTFKFATQAIIHHNEPRLNLNLPETIPEPDNRFCENKRFESVITTVSNNQQVEGASIDYKCITNKCHIGETKLNEFSDAQLKERFPICYQGTLIATKQGYHPAKLTMSTTEETSATINLEKYKTLNIEPIIQRAGSGEPIEDETIMIQMLEEEKQYNIVLSYPEEKQIKLIPGTYKTKVYLIKDYPEEITIPKREIEKCIDVPKKSITGLLGDTERKCVQTEIPSISVEQTITGTTEQTITITEQDLTKQKIIFYIPYKGVPETQEDLISKDEEFTPPRFE